MGAPKGPRDSATRVKNLYFRTVNAGAGWKAAACSMYIDAEPISKEVGVPVARLKYEVKRGSGYSEKDCRRKRRR